MNLEHTEALRNVFVYVYCIEAIVYTYLWNKEKYLFFHTSLTRLIRCDLIWQRIKLNGLVFYSIVSRMGRVKRCVAWPVTIPKKMRLQSDWLIEKTGPWPYHWHIFFLFLLLQHDNNVYVNPDKEMMTHMYNVHHRIFGSIVPWQRQLQNNNTVHLLQWSFRRFYFGEISALCSLSTLKIVYNR